MHILWHSNAPWAPTGYGNQTGLFCRLMLQRGLKVTISAYYGAEGAVLTDRSGIEVFPRLSQADPYGNEAIRAHYEFVKADAVVSLCDPFVLSPDVWGALPWAAWTPVDSLGVPPSNAEALRSARWVWAMSRWGEGELRAAGFDRVHYVPHGVDTEAFVPLNRGEARARAGRWLRGDLSGKFVVAMVAANVGIPSRKGWGYAFEAFKAFSDRHPEAVLAIHSEANGLFGGEPLQLAMAAAGLTPDKVLFPLQYPYLMAMYGDRHLNDLYNAADVLLHPSLGEGFGIPIVEAQAAGCPVIVTNFSAMPELCFGGFRVPGTLTYHTTGARQMIPNVSHLIAALEQVHLRRDAGLRLAARAGALEYDYRRVYDTHMAPALEGMQADLERQKARRARHGLGDPAADAQPA